MRRYGAGKSQGLGLTASRCSDPVSLETPGVACRLGDGRGGFYATPIRFGPVAQDADQLRQCAFTQPEPVRVASRPRPLGSASRSKATKAATGWSRPPDSQRAETLPERLRADAGSLRQIIVNTIPASNGSLRTSMASHWQRLPLPMNQKLAATRTETA